MKKRAMIIVIAIIAMILVLPLSAQTSNTNVATAGIFGNDVDDYMSYHDYAGVLGEGAKWFGYVTGHDDDDFGGLLEAGYARNLGGIYLGVFYKGFMYRSDSGKGFYNGVDEDDGVYKVDEENTINPSWDDNLEILLRKTNRTKYYQTFNETYNNVNFLIGVAGMGIKVGFAEYTKYNKNAGSGSYFDEDDNLVLGRDTVITDYLDGRKDYTGVVDQYQLSETALVPSLGWGGTFAVGGMTLKPYIDIAFGIINDTKIDKYSSFTEVNGVKQDINKSVGAGYEKGFLNPKGEVGIIVDLAKNGTVQHSVGIVYGLDLRLYTNDAEGLGNVSGEVEWTGGSVNKETIYSNRTVTETNNTYTITEVSNISHLITPGYKVTGEPGENFKLGFAAAVPIGFGSWSGDNYKKAITKTTIKYNNGLPGSVTETETTTYNWNSEVSDFSVGLELALGASYQLIPGRFGINAGISASPVKWHHHVEKSLPRTTREIATAKTTQDDGSVTQNDKTVTLKSEQDKVTVSNIWDQYTAQLSGGFTFNFNDNAALDLAVTSDLASDIDGMDIRNSNKPNSFNLNLTTVNVIFTFKY